jgi:hypothetical protein
LTENHIYANAPRVGRKKQFEERIVLSLSTEMLAAIEAARDDGEDRLTLIRAAIERELKHRQKAKKGLASLHLRRRSGRR